jgi:hypothetical protein
MDPSLPLSSGGGYPPAEIFLATPVARLVAVGGMPPILRGGERLAFGLSQAVANVLPPPAPPVSPALSTVLEMWLAARAGR